MNILTKLLSKLIISILLLLGGGSLALADVIAVIGTGNVGSALGVQLAKQGHTIIYGSREPEREDVVKLVVDTGADAKAMQPADAVAKAGIVVLAVPGDVAQDVAAGLGDLSGKILIDPTNQFGPGDDGYTSHLSSTSNAEDLQKAYPKAKVVKAFNTLSSRIVANPESAGGPVTVPLAGNDADAKAIVAEMVKGIGLEPIDIGSVRFAHILEGMLVAKINARNNGTPIDFYFRPSPAQPKRKK